MLHYTLNTGHTVDSPREEVSADAIRLLSPLVQRGGGPLPPPFSAFNMELTIDDGCAVFDIQRAGQCIVLCGVAWTEDGANEAWEALEQTYLGLGDSHPDVVAPGAAPERPETLPWLAVVILPGIILQAQTDMYWLGDCERCMAWAIIEGSKHL